MLEIVRLVKPGPALTRRSGTPAAGLERGRRSGHLALTERFAGPAKLLGHPSGARPCAWI